MLQERIWVGRNSTETGGDDQARGRNLYEKAHGETTKVKGQRQKSFAPWYGSRADREICQEPKSKLDSHWNARPDWPFQAPHGKRCQPSHFNGALSGAHCPRKVICEYG